MAIQTINIGNQVNDGLGDDLRTAFEKVNANFVELESVLTITASNLGTTGEGVFAQKDGADLQFKKLLGGTKTSLTASDTSITINSTQPDAFTTITTELGVVEADNNTDITIQGGDNLRATATGSVITVDSILDLDAILTNFDFGPINGGFEYPTQLALAGANIDFGTVTTPGLLSVDLSTIVGG